MKPGMYIYHGTLAHLHGVISLISVCVYVYAARQWLSKIITAATKTHATTEELLDMSFPMRRMSYQRKMSNWFFPELLVLLHFYAYNLIWPFRIKANSASLSPAQLSSSQTKL
jgi:hypothetical protein